MAKILRKQRKSLNSRRNDYVNTIKGSKNPDAYKMPGSMVK